jgi:hypothetical protein
MIPSRYASFVNNSIWLLNEDTNLQLYSDTDSKSPIAQFKKTHQKTEDSAGMKRVTTTATLTLISLPDSIQDSVLISLLILEKRNLVKGGVKDTGFGLSTAVGALGAMAT